MNIDELLASYDPIDIEYKNRFGFGKEESVQRKSSFSFIPNREEVEEILLDPLRRMQGAETEEES